jgi:hypothetical protein
MNAEQRVEALGPAERILNSLTQYTDHMLHNRPGFVVPDGRHKVGVRWEQATWVKEGGQKVVYKTQKVGKMTRRVQRMGVLDGGNEVKEGDRVVGHFQPAGLFQPVVAHLYQQVVEVWKVDNEFAARWASWAFENEENRDMRVLLAAFMLVQNRFGEPIKDGKEIFLDEDYRAVGEAMCLLHNKKKGFTFNPKLLLRVGEVLETPGVIEVNRKMGFGKSARRAAMGRYDLVVGKWLSHCELNPKILEKMVKEGFRKGIMALARKVGYKPTTEKFFEVLRWKQVQSKAGHRTVAIGKKVKKADTWEGLTEKQICNRIVKEKPGYKVIAGKLPKEMGLTPAILAAAIETGCLSDADLIMMTPTLEELGLLKDKDVEAKWKVAMSRAENQRATNIARNVKSVAVKEELAKAADTAAAKAVEEVTKDFRIYVIVDRSGSMQGAIERAKEYCSKFVGSFPLDRLHVCVFNTEAKEVRIPRASAVGVEQAFRGIAAGGGTSYAVGTQILLKYPPKEGEDALLIYIGDEEDPNPEFVVETIRQSGVHPVAFGLLHIESTPGAPTWPGVQRNVIQRAAATLGIPCFMIDENIFADPYAVPRTIRNIIAATPVGKVVGPAPTKRVSLIQKILDTPLLQKPVWA